MKKETKKRAMRLLPAAVAGTAAAALVAKAAKFVPEKREAMPFEDENVNLDRFIENLSDAIKIPTITCGEAEKIDWSQFLKFHAFLEERYPLIHKSLSKELVNGYSLLYLWKGKNPGLDPIALLSHQDVVPVSEGTEQDWKFPPFSGHFDGENIWGRGSLDMKNHLIGVMESVETLLEEGFEPERDVYLCFGQDEEIMCGKDSGAYAIMSILKERGVHLDSIIDEGGAIIPANIKGVMNKKLAGVGVAEKGYADFEISVLAKGGHSSQPPKHTALGEMADVIKDLEGNQFKAKINPMMSELLERVGRNVSLPARLITSNLSALKPLLARIMIEIPPAACMIRTTTAVTMASGSPSENVLPQKASINVNFRLMPGMKLSDVEDHIKKVVRNKNIEIRFKKGKEPSKISPTDSRAFKAIEDICFGMDKDRIVAPFLVMGGTDACQYEDVCENIYRFSPFVFGAELLLVAHGTNERIPVSCMRDGIVFFKKYIKTLAGE